QDMPSFVQARQKVIEVAAAQRHASTRETAYLVRQRAPNAAASGSGTTEGSAGAWGRVLAETIVADRDYPPFDRSTRDGFAVRAADAAHAGAALQCIGEIKAGAGFDKEIGAGQCVQ